MKNYTIRNVKLHSRLYNLWYKR